MEEIYRGVKLEALVSVIIPVFRVEDYLDRCVQSVCDQSYNNLQIILVDDGSDDNCPQMCDEWKNKDNRIQVIHKKNGGLSDARNAGLDVANGEFVYFLDSDDYIKVNAIERLVGVITDKNADAVVLGYTKIDEKGNVIRESELETGEYSFKTEKEKLKFICRVLSQYRIGWEAWSRLYRMNIIKDNNLRFEPNKEVFAEDQCFNLYYTLCSNNIVCISDKLYFYLIRSNSIMGTRKEWKINEMICIVNKVYNLARRLELKEVLSKFYYISTVLIVDMIFRMDENEYEYYANIISDKETCRNCYFGIRSWIIFMKIWGVRGGPEKLSRYKKFMKYL